MASLFIGFSKPRKFKVGAHLISWWMNTPYSHVYIRFPENRISSTVYHAAHGMVHFRTAENFSKENETVIEYKIEATEEAKKAVLQHCMNLSGEKYGYVELLKIFCLDLCERFKCNKFKTYDGSGYICSELVGTILSDFMYIEWNKPKYLLKPKDIEDKLIENLRINKEY